MNIGSLHCYPNPVVDFAQLEYSIPAPCQVSLKIYNMMGSEIITLMEGVKSKGHHELTWNSGDIPPGLYLCVLEILNESIRYSIRIVKK